ncbi:O-acetylhomoserine ami [Suhomyces tanzawaensis NRRL Y-17324]|uniref:O-acetylhomoserine ami n=1 Tax=Suhomyces tanzawaensis NRRL Y-17324 TaxID=984487 RepID=A0A1E4SKZ8_9ASCO|nr:O-acetylhomoserine ami [Suhomyces tanzawaensis NRRL Y-17324]ODV80174.1 O-acetylhomoserine ami [Suhomyces tanzawaensis NRRL Y-17324]
MPLRFNTLQLHAGQEIDPNDPVKSRAPPIYATTSYMFNSSEHSANLFAGKEPGYIYSRVQNPTNHAFETRVAALEGGIAALATSSGQSATFVTLSTLAGHGDNIVASACLYGGTYNQLKLSFRKMGVEARFVHNDDPEEFARLIDDRTKAVFFETIANPRFNFPDISKIAEVAHAKGVPVVIDNTFGAGGFLVRPIDHGADIVVHSATKWISGHGTTIGGVIVDSGKFPWMDYPEKFPDITQPNEGYDDQVFGAVFGPAAFIMAARLQNLRDTGPVANPFSSFLLLQGLETLSLRVERQCQNALNLAKYLEKSPHVKSVSYVGLPSHSHHEVAKKYLRHKDLWGSVMTIEVEGSDQEAEPFKEPASAVVDNLKLWSHLANVGDSKSLVIAPWFTSHGQMKDEDKVKTGITKGMIRLSVGTEDIEDLIEDLEQSFKIVYGHK